MDAKSLARNLRESAGIFEKSAYVLPAMEGFIRRHIKEIRLAADALDLAYDGQEAKDGT